MKQVSFEEAIQLSPGSLLHFKGDDRGPGFFCLVLEQGDIKSSNIAIGRTRNSYDFIALEISSLLKTKYLLFSTDTITLL